MHTMTFRLVIAIAGLSLASSVCAQSVGDFVNVTADARKDIVGVVSGAQAEFVYVGQYKGCDQVAVIWRDRPQQNFERCGQGQAQDKHSLEPGWPTDDSTQDLLQMMVQNAMRYGHANTTDKNGYQIDVQRLPDVGGCAAVEAKVSYAGDLVDRAIHRACD